MEDCSGYLVIFGKRVKTIYLELFALVVGGLIYGYCKSHFENDWYALGIATVALITAKAIIVWFTRKETQAHDNT